MVGWRNVAGEKAWESRASGLGEMVSVGHCCVRWQVPLPVYCPLAKLPTFSPHGEDKTNPGGTDQRDPYWYLVELTIPLSYTLDLRSCFSDLNMMTNEIAEHILTTNISVNSLTSSNKNKFKVQNSYGNQISNWPRIWLLKIQTLTSICFIWA